VIREAIEALAERGVVANQLAIKWIVPFHAEAVGGILSEAKRVIMVENSYSGQFARYLRSETGFAAHGHIRKYDGEPFMPHHVVEGVLELLVGDADSDLYVPHQEIIV
jgi:2-oxoglutarate ferredoxin oxidoreductase subunit alpha